MPQMIAERLAEYLRAAGGKLAPRSGPPPHAKDWPDLRAAFPAAPTELRDFLAAHNGDAGGRLLPPFTLFSARHIADHSPGMVAFWEGVDRTSGFVGWSGTQPPGCCRQDRSWREAWIAIGEDNGDPLFLDGDPGGHGVAGQVVLAQDSGRALLVLATSLSDLLARAARRASASADKTLTLYPHELAKA